MTTGRPTTSGRPLFYFSSAFSNQSTGASSTYSAQMYHTPVRSRSSDTVILSSGYASFTQYYLDILISRRFQILMIALGFAQVKTGFDSWDKPGDMVTHGSLIAWGVLFALWSVVYLAGLALIPSQWSAQKTLVGVGKKDDSYEVGNGTRGSNAALTSGEA